ncbi:MAG: PqqD family protein [Clostridiales bacterium]|nr:PqqD family protein [Clostridiales bacterium]
MKLSSKFLIHAQEDKNEYLLIPVSTASFSGVVRGNRTFYLILKGLEKGASEEEMVQDLISIGAPEDLARSDVQTTISKLTEIGAIDE